MQKPVRTARARMRLVVLAGALTVSVLATTGNAMAAPVQPSKLRPLARLALRLNAQNIKVPDELAPSTETAAGRVYGMFVLGTVTRAEIEATGARAGTVLPVGATAYGTLGQLQALGAIPGVTGVELSGKAKPALDQSVPATHAAEVNHANTAGIPHVWSGSAPGSFAGTTGSGVVVGVVDSGIDINNTDFKVGGNTRIAYLWDQAACPTSVMPASCNRTAGYTGNPSGFTYGVECAAAAINAATCGPFNYYFNPATGFGTCDTPVSTTFPTRVRQLPEEDCDGHGTHVAGIAASNGRNNGNAVEPAGKYVGMAPEADLVVVKTTFGLSEIVDGVNYVFGRATAMGEPAVVNLSLGVNSGPHDGTSPMETMLNALSGPAHPGHLVTVAAGNPGTRGFGNAAVYSHIGGRLTQAGVVTNNLWVQDDTGGPFIDLWYPAGDLLTARVTGPGGVDTGFVGPDRPMQNIGTDGTCDGSITAPPPTAGPPTPGFSNANHDEVFIDSCASAGGNEITIFLVNTQTANGALSGCTFNTPCVDNWKVQLRGDSVLNGAFDAWAYDNGGYWFHNGGAGSSNLGSDLRTVALPATAHDVISVGSWIDRNAWPAQSGAYTNNAPIGALSRFSAVGPTRDGRPGIDIAAPGDIIGSSLSAAASTGIEQACGGTADQCISPDGAHVFVRGTSMSTPHVAGALALLLSQQPSMTTDQARRVLTDTAGADGFTASCPAGVATGREKCWGAGKLLLGPGITSVTPSHGAFNATTPVHVCGADLQTGMHVTFAPVGAGAAVDLGTPTITTGCFDVSMPPQSAPGIVSMTLTNTDTSTGVDRAAFTFDALAGVLHTVAPTRYLETRASGRTSGCFVGSSPVTCDAIGPDAPRPSMDVTVTGGAQSIPSNATAVVMNVTVVDTTKPSFLTVWPTGVPMPTTSNLNFAGGQIVPNLVTVPVGANGRVSVANNQGSTNVLFDISGYYAPFTSGDAGKYKPGAPFRLLDTRPAYGPIGSCFDPAAGDGALPSCAGALAPHQSRDVQVLGQGTIPGSGVSAVTVNITVVDNGGGGGSFLTAYPSNGSTSGRPNVSNLNFGPGQIVPNRAVVPVGSNGKITIYNEGDNVDVIIDINGWFSDGGQVVAGGLYVPVTPARIYDSRDSIPIGKDASRALVVGGVGGIPSAATAVIMNVTVANASANSFLTVYPFGISRPDPASDLNFAAGQIVPNLVVVQLGSGKVNVYNNQGQTDVILDVEGYYT